MDISKIQEEEKDALEDKQEIDRDTEVVKLEEKQDDEEDEKDKADEAIREAESEIDKIEDKK
jgi:hypothetical protein